MTTTLGQLRETVDLLVLEILGKFNFAEFKKIAATNIRQKEPRTRHPSDLPKNFTIHPELEYARRFLPNLGEGSSRITFALSGGKVLKIAKNNAGIAQNREELDTFTKLKNNSLVTKIFDVSPEYKWLVSELVKPFGAGFWDDEFEKYVGLDPGRFWKLYEKIKLGIDPFDWINEQINRLESYNKTIEKELGTATDMRNATRLRHIDQNNEQIQLWQNLAKNPSAINLAREIVDFVNTGMDDRDIQRADHYGRTVDGQIKLLDYGFSEEIGGKFYGFGGGKGQTRPDDSSQEGGSWG